MKINSVSIDNFLQISALDLPLSETTPVHLIAGLNESGKSSIHEAIRYAILGETQRVHLKRDYPRMVRDGAKTGSIRVEYVNERGDHDFIHREVETGKIIDGYTGDPEFAVAEVMDATKFPYYDHKMQREILSRLLHIKIDREDVRNRLLRRKIPEEQIDAVMPMLRAGFEAAHKEAKAQQSACRAKWEALTNERWGTNKGAEWEPTKKIIVGSMVQAQQREADKYEKAWKSALEKLAVQKAYKGGVSCPCPSCGVKLTFTGQDFVLYDDQPTPSEMKENTKERKEADNLEKLYKQEIAKLQEMEADLAFNERLDEIKKETKELHGDILVWMQIAEAFAADGIPGEIISDKLKPVNDRLRETSAATGWDQVRITTNMEVEIGTLPYSLGSESAHWRAQAAIAEAISYVGEIGLLCLDRIDVLDIPNRSRLLKWINKVAASHDTILLFGTLKEAPAKLPPTFTLHWLESGREVSNKAA
jgi:hypothetical protein